MDIILHGGMVSAVILVAGFSLVRLNIITRVRSGLCYWRGWVFGVGEQGRAGVGVENVGRAQRAGRGKSPACEGSIKRLAADSKGGGALRGAAESVNQGGNSGVVHGGVSRARLRLVVYAQSPDGCQLLVALIWQCCDGRPYKGQSVFSMPVIRG